MLDTSKCIPSPFIIGLTGGIGSGKTVASDWFITQGIIVVDADVIAHKIVQKGSETLAQIVNQFGDWVLTTSGELNRQAMREFVFSNPQALAQLESITHPAIRQQVMAELQQASSTYVILSAPLLLEKNSSRLVNLCHRVLVIDVPEELQLARASQRDGQDIDRIKAIMANQLSRQERLQYADDVVVNDGDITDLYQKLAILHQDYLLLAKNSR